MNKLKLQNLSFTDYIDIFWRRKWLFTIPVAVLFLVALIASFVVKPLYRSSTLILVEMMKVGEGMESGRYSGHLETGLYDEIETFTKLFGSKPFLEMLADELSVKLPEYDPIGAEVKLSELKDSLGIEITGPRGILKITGYGKNPILCAKLANTATEVFIKYYKQTGFDRSTAEVGFLTEQKALYKKKFETAQENLRKFKEDNQDLLFFMNVSKRLIANPDSLSGTNRAPISRFVDYRDMLFELNLTMEDLQRKRDELQDELTKGIQDSILQVDDPVMQEMLKTLAGKSIEMAKLKASGLTGAHPTMDKLKRDVSGIELALKERADVIKAGKDKEVFNPVYSKIRREIESSDRQLKWLKSRIKTIEKISSDQKRVLRSIPEREQALDELQRDYDVNAKIYTELTAKLEMSIFNQSLAQEEKGVRFKIIEPGVVPLYPFKPNRKFMLLVGTIFGVMVGLSLTAFAEVSDTSFNSTEELQQAVSRPVLGNVDLMYTAKEAELSRIRHNVLLFTLIAVFLSVFFALALRFVL
ncbi:MAG: hypothetical protein HY589_00430 [Candidatus Omnitrophica bacterium]|nr:hypothetical protein [Candidatus Omnitrophota bacterium]